MKNILIISPASVGTIPSVAYNLYKALSVCENINVYTLILNNNGISPFPANSTFIYRKSRFGYLSKIYFLRDIKKRLKIDLTISTLVGCTTLNMLSGGSDKKIGIFHAPLFQTKNVSLLNYILCWLSYKTLFRFLDKLYSVSETTKKDVELHTGRKSELVYNIHDFNLILQKSEEKLSLNESLIFQSKTILYVGHLYDTKGVRRLLKAFANVKTECNLVIVGGDANGEIPQSYRDLTKDLNIENKTFFLGFQQNPYKYMKNCSLFVLPSYSEGLPGVLIEALSLNKKVITTNSSIGNWEIMQCYEDYIKDLRNPYENELGLIISNNDIDDECTSQMALSLDKLLIEKVDENLPFDKSRFEGKSLVKYYIL